VPGKLSSTVLHIKCCVVAVSQMHRHIIMSKQLRLMRLRHGWQKQHSLASECRRDYNKRVKEVVEKSWIDGGGADDDDDTK